MSSRKVGRGAQSPAPSPRGAVVSLSGYIPVPALPDAMRDIGGAGRKRDRSLLFFTRESDVGLVAA
jgi:hypothetical protein